MVSILNNGDKWANINGYNNLYWVSDKGCVIKVSHLCLGNGGVDYFKAEKILTQFTTKKGYKVVYLCEKNTKKKHSVHRLVGEYFISNTENKPQINHINGITDDNRVENLEWCTAKENVNHSYKVLNKQHNCIGMFNKGGKKVAMYDLQGNFIQFFESTMDVQRKMNIPNSRVSSNCLGKSKTTHNFIFKYH
jgi:hypothetical protein